MKITDISDTLLNDLIEKSILDNLNNDFIQLLKDELERRLTINHEVPK
ncbi:sporulation histidine kinase inhibitor Sda [Shouchella lehensis]|uniref:Sporulation histidine kinase inhibitor Sda n=1 Tax=Shouchella lehensis TaxID=300825 RepID=A0A4Y7WKW3_9BACI|nr:sporulation histidine kinase inhibitor Sda [Shouchella lehensis]RQW22479.1 sporulation histidine kinase inhibitor Sda [Bacillus sp. C1-1]TES49299.1 sporulation histidine kinase inhibitor Sda [Shouchella lehensis]